MPEPTIPDAACDAYQAAINGMTDHRDHPGHTMNCYVRAGLVAAYPILMAEYYQGQRWRQLADDDEWRQTWLTAHGLESDATPQQVLTAVGQDCYPRNGAHIARHDPARVLRQVAAHRKILDNARWAFRDAEMQGGDPRADALMQGRRITFEFVLRALAEAHDIHDDTGGREA